MTYLLAARSGAAVLALAALWLFEQAAPRRVPTAPKLGRWLGNLGLFASDAALTLLLSGALSISAAGFALWVEDRRIGVLHHVDLPYGAKFAVAFLALDLTIYLQHWAFHAVPLFWRFHKVHHTDLDVDATTALRFHPVEIALSLALKLGVIAALGAHFLAVAVFEAALTTCAIFNHANVSIPRPVDRVLRWLVVTPDMHRVHHSVRPAERDSNFGFCAPWWDRLFGTYEAEPAEGHREMRLGLEAHREPRAQTALWLLALPFRRGEAA